MYSAVAAPELETIELAKNHVPAIETDRSELIRQYMSELGKRSAAARAKKRKATSKFQISKHEC